MAQPAARRPSGQPTGSARLRAVLERLVGYDAAAGNGRPAGPADGAGALAALLREIDETVLARELALTAATGGVARLAISNRRLVSLRIDGDPDPDDPPPDPYSAARHYVRLLRQFLKDAVTVEFALARIGFDPDLPGARCSARNLADTAALPLAGDGDAARIGAFAGAIAPLAVAWSLEPGAAAVETSGDESDLACLAAVADTLADPGSRQATSWGGADPICVLLPSAPGSRTLVASAGPARFLALLPEQHMRETLTAWNAIVRHD